MLFESLLVMFLDRITFSYVVGKKNNTKLNSPENTIQIWWKHYCHFARISIKKKERRLMILSSLVKNCIEIIYKINFHFKLCTIHIQKVWIDPHYFDATTPDSFPEIFFKKFYKADFARRERREKKSLCGR